MIFREVKKREMEMAFLDFQKHQAEEKRADRQREKEEALRMRRLAEHAAEEAKVCSFCISCLHKNKNNIFK